MAGQNIFIAKRKNERTHVFLRAYRKEALSDIDCAFSADSLDKLLLAQDPESFANAVSSFRPLTIEPLCKMEAKSRPRKWTVVNFRDEYEACYEPVDEAILIEELTGVKGDMRELNKSSLKRIAKGLDATRDDSFIRHLSDNAFADDDYVIAEPVLDWTTAKAFVGNIVLFQAYLGNETRRLDFSEVTTHNGNWVFGKAFDKRVEERVKQFVYNSYWRTETVRGMLRDSLRSDQAHSSDPLLSKYFDWSLHSMDNGKGVNRLRNSEHIYLKNAQQISGERLPLFAKARTAVFDRSLYLTADIDCSERVLAQDFIRAVLLTTQELVSENGVKLGWEYDLSAAADQADRPKVIFRSQWAQLVYDVAFHPQDTKAVVCKNCGRPMLNQQSSRFRQFCRPSCRTSYSAAHKAVKND